MRDLKGGVRTEVGRHGIRRLRWEWGHWLSGFSWNHFVTLTFGSRADLHYALRQFARWIRDLERRARQPVLWGVAPERTTADTVHLHVLLSGTGALHRDCIERSWQPGFARSTGYDDRLGASHYLAKGISDYWCEIDVDPRLVRQVKYKVYSGCRNDPTKHRDPMLYRTPDRFDRRCDSCSP